MVRKSCGAKKVHPCAGLVVLKYRMPALVSSPESTLVVLWLGKFVPGHEMEALRLGTFAPGKALELLDALTRSGALVVEEAALHVILAATHAFDKGLVDTVVQDNLNPILQVRAESKPFPVEFVLGQRAMRVDSAR